LKNQYMVNIMSLGENIKRLRGDRGWTQGILAKKSGLGLNLVSKLERNASDPKLSTIYKLMNAFNCSADKLLMDPEKVGIDGILESTLERALNLPEANKRVVIEIVDKYCIAVGLEQSFNGENGPKLRVFTSAPKSALPDKGAG